MITFLKMNKRLITFSTILILIPFFGFNFLISLIGNVLLLLFLVPILIFLIVLIGFNFLKSKAKTCYQCGTISMGTDNTCMNCGADLSYDYIQDMEESNKPGEKIIEIKAEEIK